MSARPVAGLSLSASGVVERAQPAPRCFTCKHYDAGWCRNTSVILYAYGAIGVRHEPEVYRWDVYDDAEEWGDRDGKPIPMPVFTGQLAQGHARLATRAFVKLCSKWCKGRIGGVKSLDPDYVPPHLRLRWGR